MRSLIAILSCVVLGAAAYGTERTDIEVTASPEDKGRAIAVEAERRHSGFGDSVTELAMTLIGSDGRTRTRRLTWQTLEGTEPGAGDKSLTLFHEPRDIAGTAFLSHTYVDRPDEQWLYLPSLRRVRRIAPANQSSAFVGSELSYEDLLSDEVERFDYRWLRDEACANSTCFVVERHPRGADSGYSKQIIWLDQDEFRPMQIEFHDRRERHEKTLTLEDYSLYADRFWRAHAMTMENHLTGRTTVLEFGAFEFQTGLSAAAFDPSALRRLW
jgi:outer membrane lipoprotein-sorting protein